MPSFPFPRIRIREHRLRLLAVLTVAFLALVLFRPPIPQDPAYHDFADQRTLADIPHALNVVSNLALVLTGLYGFFHLARLARTGSAAFETRAEAVPYAALFIAVSLSGLGSAYYHLAPDTPRLFWDRLPMSLVFMAYLAAALVERIDRRTGLIAMLPLMAAGLLSVLHWRSTELAGAGDLRYYVVVQAYPALFVLLMVLLPSAYTHGRMLVTVTGLYLLAKLAEVGDDAIFDLGHLVSGHTLKHLFAAAATWEVLRMLRLRRPQRLPPAAPST